MFCVTSILARQGNGLKTQWSLLVPQIRAFVDLPYIPHFLYPFIPITMATEKLQTFPQKPRVFILSDISNEPDDAESLCRYLLYANQFETEGLVACTSTWMKNKVCPQDMEKIIDAYAGAVENLNKHVHPDWPYPSAKHFRSLIRKGAEVRHEIMQHQVTCYSILTKM
jgi:hypothetical protein